MALNALFNAGFVDPSSSWRTYGGFQNWQVTFPGVWRQWESKELIGGFHAAAGN